MYKSGKFFNIPNKYWEIQTGKWDNWLSLNLDLEYTTKQDHAGFRFYINLFSFHFGITIYDSRHWNDDTNDWEVYK